MNCCCQRKEKYLSLLKIDKSTKTIDYGDLKFIITISGTETDFSELLDPVAFLDRIRRREISIEEARHKQETF